MSTDHDLALSSILKGQHKVIQALEDQAQQINAIKGTLQKILDELRFLSEEREP